MIGVVCHDAGGAELVSSYVRREGVEAVFALEGPARAIFARKLGVQTSVGLDEVIARADWVLCGSGWQSDLEWRGIEMARAAGKRVVSMLDHWVNFRDRFDRHGTMMFPDEVWVGDEAAREVAARELPDVPVRVVPNPYFADLQDEIAQARQRQLPRTGPMRVLYASEPTAAHCLERYGNERHWGYTEIDALGFFLKHRGAVGLESAEIVLRPHPAESPGKYADLLATAGGRVSDTQSLIDDILAADVVVGCLTSAMTIARLAGKRVLCSIPPGGFTFNIPLPPGERLSEVVSEPR